MRPSASPIAVWAGLIVLYLVWGSTYLGIKVAVETVPPFVMGFIRFVPAGILLAGVVALRNRRIIERPSRRALADTLIVGALLLMGGMGLVAWAEQTIPSGIAALLIALMPMWLAIFGLVFLGERLPRAGRDRDRRRRRRGRDPRLADRRRRRPRPGRPARAARLPGLLGARRDLRRPPGGPAGARTVRERPGDDRRRPRPARRQRGHRRAGDVRSGRGLHRELGRHRCTCCWSAASWATPPSPGWCRSRRSRAWPPTRT